MLELIEDAMSCGAIGIALGRNVWQIADPTRMLASVIELVHQDKNVSELSWTRAILRQLATAGRQADGSLSHL